MQTFGLSIDGDDGSEVVGQLVLDELFVVEDGSEVFLRVVVQLGPNRSTIISRLWNPIPWAESWPAWVKNLKRRLILSASEDRWILAEETYKYTFHRGTPIQK